MSGNIILLVILCISVWGQEKPQDKAPTLEETTQWLEENLPTKARVTVQETGAEFSWVVKEFVTTGCRCTLLEETIVKRGRLVASTKNLYSIPVAALDKDSLQVSARKITPNSPNELWRFGFRTGRGEKVIQDESWKRDPVSGVTSNTTMRSDVVVFMESKESAERIQKALLHYITLCQAKDKKDPF